MRTLRLHIENHATLENGGPISFTLNGQGAQIGRKNGMDWVLPDASRHISGHHFDLSARNQVFYLTDVSSNGTFLHGERYRLSAPHQISEGDRFVVGHYMIRAEITEQPNYAPNPPAAPANPAASVAPPPDPSAASASDFDDVWGAGPSASPAPSPTPSPGGAQTGVQLPPALAALHGQQEPAAPTPNPPATNLTAPPAITNATLTASRISMPPTLAAATSATPEPGPAPPATVPLPPPAVAPSPEPAASPPPPVAAPEPPAPAPPITDPVQAQPAEPGAAPYLEPPPAAQSDWQAPALAPSAPDVPTESAGGDAFVQAFLRGAGVSDASEMDIPLEDLAFMLGQIARTSTNELMRLLQDRAAVKLFVSGEDRTMRIANGNNPMKFMPDAEQAFQTMFLKRREGYMTGADGFENALTDIRRHHNAIVAALQPALAEILDGLSPEDITEDVDKGPLGGGPRKAWAAYMKRWEERAAQGENGMLDAFIKAFSKHYSNAVRKI